MLFFQIIRWKNLLMIALLQALIKYYLIPEFDISEELSAISFIFLVTATLFIAAAGYIINDINDIEIDRINKPDLVWIPHKLTLIQAKRIYWGLNFTGLFVAGVLASYQHNYLAFFAFVIPVLLLNFYAVYAKRKLLIGNLIVSLLIVLSIFVVLLFEYHSFTNYLFIEVIGGISLFAFLLTLAREICKDAEDMIGDTAYNVQSIPIKYGLSLTNKLIWSIVGFIILFVFFIVIWGYKTHTAFVIYLLTGVVPGLLLLLFQIDKAKKNEDYAKLSTLFKLMMFVGIISLIFINMV